MKHALAGTLVIAMSFLPGCTVSYQPSSAIPISDSSQRIVFQGFTILPPQGPGWLVKDKSMYLARMGKRIDKDHTIVALVDVSFAGTAISGPQQLRDYIQRQLSAKDAETKVEIPDSAAQGAEYVCVRSESSGEATGKNGTKGRDYHLALHGRHCLHPDFAKMVVSLSYSRRSSLQTDPGPSGAEAEAVLSSLEFEELEKPHVTSIIPVGEQPQELAASHGSVWVPCIMSNSVARIDTASGMVKAMIPVGRAPAMVVATEDAVWVTNKEGNSVSRINPTTDKVVETIKVGGQPLGLAVGAGSVWVVNNGDNTVSRINVDNNSVEAVIKVGNKPSDIEFAEGYAWVLNQRAGTILGLDPGTNTIAGKAIPVGENSGFLTAANGSLWVVAVSSGTVTRVDLKSLSVTDRFQSANSCVNVAFGGGRLWTLGVREGSLASIDPSTGKAIGKPVPIGRAPLGIVHADNSIWASSWKDGSVYRVDYR